VTLVISLRKCLTDDDSVFCARPRRANTCRAAPAVCQDIRHLSPATVLKWSRRRDTLSRPGTPPDGTMENEQWGYRAPFPCR
jgi:hypothetical protein